MHGADPFTPPLHQEGRCHGTRTQSSIPVSDADFPYNFGQVSQDNPGHMEMNGKILIDMRAGFHLNLLASEPLIFHLKPFTSCLFCPSHLCYKLSKRESLHNTWNLQELTRGGASPCSCHADDRQ